MISSIRSWPLGGLTTGSDTDIHASLLDLTAPPLPDGLTEEIRNSLQEWQVSGIGRPFVPEEFAEHLEILEEWSWGCLPSRNSRAEKPGAPVDAYMQHPEATRFLAGDWRPRYHVCHAGHGVNSYGMNYVIVTDRLAIVAQAGWGGIYMNPLKSAAAVVDLSADLADLFRFAQSIREWPGGRLLVVHSDFRGGNEPSWVPSPGARPVPIRGKDAGVLGALQAIHGLWLAENMAGPPPGTQEMADVPLDLLV